jgi:hypothetical protein
MSKNKGPQPLNQAAIKQVVDAYKNDRGTGDLGKALLKAVGHVR